MRARPTRTNAILFFFSFPKNPTIVEYVVIELKISLSYAILASLPSISAGNP